MAVIVLTDGIRVDTGAQANLAAQPVNLGRMRFVTDQEGGALYLDSSFAHVKIGSADLANIDNTLTGTSITRPLSAAQGKALNDKIVALESISATDLIATPGAPTPGDGVDGNYALNLSNGEITGAKAGGTWPVTVVGNAFNQLGLATVAPADPAAAAAVGTDATAARADHVHKQQDTLYSADGNWNGTRTASSIGGALNIDVIGLLTGETSKIFIDKDSSRVSANGPTSGPGNGIAVNSRAEASGSHALLEAVTLDATRTTNVTATSTAIVMANTFGAATSSVGLPAAGGVEIIFPATGPLNIKAGAAASTPGTAGQLLSSQGAALPPVWADAATGAALSASAPVNLAAVAAAGSATDASPADHVHQVPQWTDLRQTPATISANQLVIGNAAGTDIEFASGVAGGTF